MARAVPEITRHAPSAGARRKGDMYYQVIDGLLGDVPVWGTPGGGIMPADQPVAVSDADAAFRGLYTEHGPALLRLATALTGGDRGRAEDLVQETMLRAWTHRANLDIQHRSPRVWLITVAQRLAVDAHRARRARPAEVELDEHLELRRRPAGRRQHRRRRRPRRNRRSARSEAPGTGRSLLPRPVGGRNGAHTADPARHGEITHLRRVARAAPRPGSSRCGGPAPRGHAVARATAAAPGRTTQLPGQGPRARPEGTWTWTLIPEPWANARARDPAAGQRHGSTGRWQDFLLTGLAWLLISVIVLQFTLTSAAAAGALAGVAVLLCAPAESPITSAGSGLPPRRRLARYALAAVPAPVLTLLPACAAD